MRTRRSFQTISYLIIPYLIFLSTTSFLFSENQSFQEVEKALNAEKENPEKAASILEIALTLFPDNFDIMFQLGRIYFEYSEEISDSRNKQLEKANLIGQNQTSDYFQQLAFTTLVKAQQIEPKHPDTLFILAKISLRYKKYKEVIAYLKKYLELVPDAPEALFLQGFAYSSINDYANAEKKFEQAIKLNSGNGQNYYNLGVILQKQEKYKKALSNLLIAANLFSRQEKKSELVDALTSAGICAIKSGKPEDGVKYYESAVSINPYNPVGYFNLAAFYVQKKYYDKALQVYNTYLNYVTDDANVYHRIISLLDITGKYQAGIKILEKLHIKDEKNLYVIYFLAELYRLNKDYKNAEKYFVECINTAGKTSPFTVHSIKKVNEMKKINSKEDKKATPTPVQKEEKKAQNPPKQKEGKKTESPPKK